MSVVRAGVSFVLAAAIATPVIAVAAVAAATNQARSTGPVTLGPGVPAKYRADLLAAAKRCPRISPSVLAAQLATESNWNPNAVSPVGARGLAQFMPATWKQWGGDLDGDGTNSPTDPGDATRAQADYMCHLLDTITGHHLGGGDPVTITSLALAGYNAGPGAVLRYRGIPPYPETRHYVDRIWALATSPDYAIELVDDPETVTGDLPTGGVDALLPTGYRNGRTAQAAVKWALSQVGVWRDAGYCLRFVGRQAFQRPWDGASIDQAHEVWDNAPSTMHHRGDYNPPRGAIVLWNSSIGSGAGHIAISLGAGKMVTTTRGAVAIRPIRGFADHAYLGWMPPYLVSR